MGLLIQFVDSTVTPPVETERFRLRVDPKQEGGWIAPELHVLPSKTLPAISEIAVSVMGTPAAVATRIEAAFGKHQKFPKPVQLHERRAISPGRIREAGPLDSKAVCEMRVTVHFFETDKEGKPRGELQTAVKVCELYSGDASARKPELTVANTELTLTVDEPNSQIVDVEHSRSAEPKLALLHPDTVVDPLDPVRARLHAVEAELKASFVAALKVTPKRMGSTASKTSFRFPLNLKLSEAVKDVLKLLDTPLAVPMLVTLPEATSRQWMLKLAPKSKVFPGWVVIDFGTTNSTVTVYDTQDRYDIVGLPEEQESVLKRKLMEWLRELPLTAVDKRRSLEDNWKALKQQTATNLSLPSGDSIVEWLSGSESNRLYAFIKEMELNLKYMPEPFRRFVYGRWNRILREALHIPSLRRFQLFPITLNQDKKEYSVSSEMEITSVEQRRGDHWPIVRIGEKAQTGRMAAIAQAEGDAAVLEQALQRFHPSPKRHFGTERAPFNVVSPGRTQPFEISVDQLMRAGWEKLLQLADEARKTGGFSPGAFRKAIITYPTVAPPSVRQTIQRLLKDLGISDVRTDYDEAIASAIFYFMREYTAYPELGLESFKARSRLRTENSWAQNVLVFDIGGGTTDVALIRLTLTEEQVFDPGEDCGAGGRYYKISPQIISSSGHMQLGGELMTLRIFRLLKAKIADRLLCMVRDGKLTCDPIKRELETIPQEARKDGKYETGYLPRVVENENPDMLSSLLRAALELAERVLPTRWADASDNRTARLQTFYILWQYAEEAKKKLGSKDPGNKNRTIDENYTVTGEKVVELISTLFPGVNTTGKSKELAVNIEPRQIEKAIDKVVDDAVRIALGTLEHLKTSGENPQPDKLDWLILSGQSCNLALVDQEIRKAFKESDRFIWNPERVTFLPEYAKLSTSVGACYAENQRRNRQSPKAYKGELRRGRNELFFDIDNLFSYLPGAFLIAQAGGNQEIFKSGTELFDIRGDNTDEEPSGQARSATLGAALNVSIFRQDYKGGKLLTWGVLDGQSIANQLEIAEDVWRQKIGFMYEVDHRLKIVVLLFRKENENAGPAIVVSSLDKNLDLKTVLPRVKEKYLQDTKKAVVPAAPGTPPPEPPTVPALVENGLLSWSLALGDTRNPNLGIFDLGQKLNTTIRRQDERSADVSMKGALSKKCLEWDTFMEDGSIQVWGQPRGAKAWYPIGKLERPGTKPVFRRRYRLTLDENGILRLHNGEPAFWESADPQCLVNEPGRVFRRDLQTTKRETDEDRNPFTGKH